MKKIFGIVLLLSCLSSLSKARDEYPVYSVKWDTQFTLNKVMLIRSRLNLTTSEKKAFGKIFKRTKQLFYDRYEGFTSKCKESSVEIRVIDRYEMSNRVFFPEEDVYSVPGEVVVGRYYKSTNVLYIIHPDGKIWKKDFAHELLHYFYDICEAQFIDGNQEHEALDRAIKEF